MPIQEALNALASVLFPAPCRICAQPLLNSRLIPICEPCLASFAPIRGALCLCCGRPQGGQNQQHTTSSLALCRLCRNKTFAFDHARNWAVYDEKLTAAIMLLKYEEVTRLGQFFAARLADLYSELAKNNPEKVGAPTSSSRFLYIQIGVASEVTIKWRSLRGPWPSVLA